MRYRKTCKLCGKPKKLPAKPVHKDVPMSAYEEDEYCSRPCCEADLGIVQSGISHSGRGKAAA